MSDGFLLSDVAIGKINELIAAHRNRYTLPRQRDTDDNQGNTSDIYIALTPLGGIPALDKGTDLGTGSGSGTGGVNDDIPGFAECNIYRLVYNSGTPSLEPIPGNTKTVHNLTASIIPEREWITVVKDKFGTWLATGLGGSSLPAPYEGFHAKLTGGTGPTYDFEQCNSNGTSIASPIISTAVESRTGETGLPIDGTTVVWVYRDSVGTYRFCAIAFNIVTVWTFNSSTCTITPTTIKKIVISGPNLDGSLYS